MKNLAKFVVVGAGVMALCLTGCEPGGGDGDAETGGSSTGTEDTGGTGTGTGTTDTGSTTSGSDDFAVLELQDDEANETLDPCDTGTLKSPGADIDAAELIDPDSTILAGLTGCNLSQTVGCQSTAADPANAEGAPTLEDGESETAYTALNGGMLRCSWEDSNSARSGDTIKVYEVGGSASTTVEQFTIRLCKNTGGNCTSDAAFASGDTTFPVDTLL